MNEFFRTRMGQRFFEATMPKIADQLERLNVNIEVLVAELRQQRCPLPKAEAKTGDAVDGSPRSGA